MSTKVEQLNNLVGQYYEDKVQLDSYKKLCEGSNAEIKNIMSELNITKHTIGDITATKSVSIKESFNEDKLINLFENSTYFSEDNGVYVCIASGLNIVKMKPYIDMDALEDALYKGLIPEDIIVKMNDCKESKETVSLRVSKKKARKENYEDAD